jgi:hypothetical protein
MTAGVNDNPAKSWQNLASGATAFAVQRRSIQAMRFDINVEIGGLTGWFADLFGMASRSRPSTALPQTTLLAFSVWFQTKDSKSYSDYCIEHRAIPVAQFHCAHFY